ENRDARVMQLYEELLEIEQRLIPTGLHVLGRPSLDSEKTDLLKMVASFDRPEFGARSLADVVAETRGLSTQYAKENVDRVVTIAIRKLIEEGIEAASDFLLRECGVNRQSVDGMLRLLSNISESLNTNNEMDSVVRALRGEFIEPGPGADIVQNPAILPTGRNTHALNSYGVPFAVDFARVEVCAHS